MSLLVTNNAEGGTNTTTVTTGNSGGTSGTAWTTVSIAASGTLTYSSTHAAHGTLSYELTTPVGGGSDILQWGSGVLSTSPTTIWFRVYVYLPALPSATIRVFKAIAGANICAAIGINSSGHVTAVNTAASNITTSSLVVPTNAWFRIEGKFVSSATVGQTEVKIFTSNMDEAIPDETNTSTATQNTGGGAITTAQIGSSTGVASLTMFVDDIGISDSAYIGAAGSPGGGAFKITNSAEQQASGTTVTSGNSGGGSDTAFNNVDIGTGAAMIFSNAQAAHGSNSYLLTTGGVAAGNALTWDSLTSNPTTGFVRLYLYLPALPGTNTPLVFFENAVNASMATLMINTTGNILFKDSGGTTIKTSTATIPVATWVRIEAKIVSSASVGVLEFKLFLTGLDNTSPDETQTSAASQNTAGLAIESVTFGTLTNVANMDMFLDDLGFDDTAYLGPAGTLSPPTPNSITVFNNAEGGTSGTTITTGNTGSTSGTAFTEITIGASATAAFSNAFAWQGTLSYKFTTPGSAVTNFVEWDSTVFTSGTTTVWARAYLYLPTLPGAALRVFTAQATSTQVGTVEITSTGHVLSRDSAGTTVQTSTSVVPTNQWFRLETMFVSDPAVGQIETRIYLGNADETRINEINSSNPTLNTTGGAITQVFFGATASIASATWYMDALGASDRSYIGPVGTAPVVETGWGSPIVPSVLTPPPLPQFAGNLAGLWGALETTGNLTNLQANGAHPPTVALDATQVFQGSHSAKLTWATGTPGGFGVGSGVRYVLTNLVIGQEYTTSVYVWNSAGNDQVFTFVSGLGFGGGTTLFNQWQQITQTFVATATTHTVGIDMETSTAGWVSWIDAISFNLGPTALPFTTVLPSLNSTIATVDGKCTLGYYQGGNLYTSQQSMEAAIGRAFRLHKFYVDASTTNAGVPSSNTQITNAANNGFLHLSFAPVIWSGTSLATVGAQAPGPFGTHPWYGYDDVTAGALDAVIDQWSTACKALPTKIIADFAAEPDDTPKTAQAKLAISLYEPALAYIINRFNSNGVTNVEWAWTVSGFQSDLTVYSSLYGVSSGASALDGLVTWIMWDPYMDGAGQAVSKFLNFYNEVQNGMLTNVAVSKYFGLGEFGIGQGASRTTPFDNVANALNGKLAMAEYWDSSTGSGYKNYTVYGTADVPAFTTMADEMD